MSKKIELPSLGDDPAYAAAAAKLTELQVQLSAASARRDAVLAELNRLAVGPQSRLDSIVAKARQLLGGDSTTQGADAAALRAELVELSEHASVLAAAIALQKETVQTFRATVSRRLVGELVPTHRALVREIAKRIVALDEALAAEAALRDELFQRDILLGALRPMPLSGFGRLRDENSRCAAYLVECVEFGFLGVGDLPPNLHESARAKLRRDPPPAPTRSKANADGWVGAAA